MNIKCSKLGAGLLLLILSLQSAAAFYDPGLQRWLNRDPIGERGGLNLFDLAQNQPIEGVDPFALIVENPPKDIGFTKADVVRAVQLADRCGIRGPGGKTMMQMFREMESSDKTLNWRIWKGVGKQIPQTQHRRDTSKPQSATIHFPRCDPNSCKADIAGQNETSFYFDAAILHEIMHAYEAMTGTHNPEAAEDLATAVGNQFQECIKNCLKDAAGQASPPGAK